MAKFVASFVLIFFTFNLSNAAFFDVINFGAKPDGKTDATQSFLEAWKSACNSSTSSTIKVPKGRYLIKPVEFRGPCKRSIKIAISGSIIAPDYREFRNSSTWILFIRVNQISLFGGTFDGKGASFWACRASGNNCPAGARSITFNFANDVIVSGLTSINSQVTHLVVNSCKNVQVRNVKMIAPDESPNTDGIHVQGSNNVTIYGSTLRSGDDCISIGPGTFNLHMSHIKCGPGHGISIGSLARQMDEEGVENVTLTDAVFTGSDNGVRIKSWARPSTGFVKNILFQNIIMTDVENPIIIDQDYCPNNIGCPGQSSGVKISEVTYKNIRGTSATEEAVTFNCSKTNPCKGITLRDIDLTYMNKATTSSCMFVEGSSAGLISLPGICL
ncbi:Pectin lyase-like superfamily protein [Euphorbia peplus]|nr:Pectin lyase-like superfamily protein [Euphorbia peplus]